MASSTRALSCPGGRMKRGSWEGCNIRVEMCVCVGGGGGSGR